MWSKRGEETLLTPGIKDNTRLFQSFTAVAGTVWIRLPANLLPRGVNPPTLPLRAGSIIPGVQGEVREGPLGGRISLGRLGPSPPEPPRPIHPHPGGGHMWERMLVGVGNSGRGEQGSRGVAVTYWGDTVLARGHIC